MTKRYQQFEILDRKRKKVEHFALLLLSSDLRMLLRKVDDSIDTLLR